MATKITNRSVAPITLPTPFRGIVGAGKSIILDATRAEVEALIEVVDHAHVFEVADVR